MRKAICTGLAVLALLGAAGCKDRPKSLTIDNCDLNGDTLPDKAEFVVVDYGFRYADYDLQVSLSQANGSYSEPVTMMNFYGSPPQGIYFADYDNDGDLDLFFNQTESRVLAVKPLIMQYKVKTFVATNDGNGNIGCEIKKLRETNWDY